MLRVLILCILQFAHITEETCSYTGRKVFSSRTVYFIKPRNYMLYLSPHHMPNLRNSSFTKLCFFFYLNKTHFNSTKLWLPLSITPTIYSFATIFNALLGELKGWVSPALTIQNINFCIRCSSSLSFMCHFHCFYALILVPCNVHLIWIVIKYSIHCPGLPAVRGMPDS